MDKLVDVLGLDLRRQLACCGCSGSLHAGLLDVGVDVETILLCMPPDADVSNADAAFDVLLVSYSILDAIHDVDANLLDANLLLLRLLLHSLLLPILASSHPLDVDAIDVRLASNSDVHLLPRSLRWYSRCELVGPNNSWFRWLSR